MAPPATGLQIIPSPSRLVLTGGRAWRPHRRTRIVTDDAWSGEARQLADDLVALGLLPAPPPIARRDAGAHDIVLAAGDGAPAPEGYALRVERSGALRIEASTTAGIYYGGRTLLQQLRAGGRFPAVHIVDAPDLAERGVTVDVGRKFYSMAWLKRLIAEMGWLKLNMLHLHLSDNEGFGYASARYPQLASSRHLSLADLGELVAFAARHHVTIVPEIDSPGHFGWALRHFPDLALRAADGKSAGRALDISLDGARTLVFDLIDELLPLFPGGSWHIGGDEVLLTERPGASPDELDKAFPQLVRHAAKTVGRPARAEDTITLFLNDLNAHLIGKGRRTRAWNDGMQGHGAVRPDRSIDIDYWENLGGTLKTAAQHIAEGHRVLNAHSRYLYYVIAEPPFPWYPRPTLPRIYSEWTVQDFEAQAPLPRPDPAVMGAHLAIWADRPADRSEEQIAGDLHGPLRALSQKCWRNTPPPLTLPAFTALADGIGAPPPLVEPAR